MPTQPKASAIAAHTPFTLGILESAGNVGRTYDDDPESPWSVAYDIGRTIGEWPEPHRSLHAAAPELLSAAQQVIARWESGDLAHAVRMLNAAVDRAKG